MFAEKLPHTQVVVTGVVARNELLIETTASVSQVPVTFVTAVCSTSNGVGLRITGIAGAVVSTVNEFILRTVVFDHKSVRVMVQSEYVPSGRALNVMGFEPTVATEVPLLHEPP